MKHGNKFGENIIQKRLIEEYESFIRSRVNLIW